MIGATHRHKMPRVVDLRRSVLDESELEDVQKRVTTLKATLKRTKDEKKVEKLKADIVSAEADAKAIVDKYDKERHNEGFYSFKDKVYINFKEPGARPPFWFSWCRYDNRDNYRHMSEWRYQFGYVPVTKDDPYWPENIPLNANGHYQVGDLCLVKCKLIDHLKRRWEEVQESKNAATNKIEEFEATVASQGDQIEQNLIQELIG